MRAIVVMLMFPIVSFAASAPSILDGSWKLSARICSDGRSPMDNLNLKETDYQTDFSESNFKFHGHINLCDFSADGFFKLEGKVLTVYYTNNSNCRGPGPKGAFKGAIFINETEFSTIANAGTACRPGESLIATFTKQK